VTSEFRLSTRNSVAKANAVVADPDESAGPEGGGGFADWEMLTLQALRIERGKFYRQPIDLLGEMPGILEEIRVTRLPHCTVLRDWFETISMETYRAFLSESAEKRTGHAAIETTGFDPDQPSHHYAQRAHPGFARSQSLPSRT